MSSPNPFVSSGRPTRRPGGVGIYDYLQYTIEVLPDGPLGWKAVASLPGGSTYYDVEARTEAGALRAIKADLDAKEAYGLDSHGYQMWFWLKHWAQKVGQPWGDLTAFHRPSRNDVARMLEINRIDHRQRKREGEPNAFDSFDWFDNLPIQDRVSFIDRAIDWSEARWTPAPTTGQVLFTSRVPNPRLEWTKRHGELTARVRVGGDRLLYKVGHPWPPWVASVRHEDRGGLEVIPVDHPGTEPQAIEAAERDYERRMGAARASNPVRRLKNRLLR